MRTYVLTIVALTLLLGCSSEEVGNLSKPKTNSKNTSVRAASRSEYSRTDKSFDVQSDADEVRKIDTHRKVVYDANIDLIVKDFSIFTKKLPELVVLSGGYVADVKLQQRQDLDAKSSYRSGIWKVKILSQKFDQFVLKLSDIGFVKAHNQTSEDVTEDYVDLQARIENKKRMEVRVLELINDSSRKLSDIMNLEKELSRIRGEIERMQGRLNLLTNRSEYATLTITAFEKLDPMVVATPSFSIRVSNTWSESMSMLASFVQGLIVFFVAIIPWLVGFVFLLAIGCVFVAIVNRFSKTRIEIRKV